MYNCVKFSFLETYFVLTVVTYAGLPLLSRFQTFFLQAARDVETAGRRTCLAGSSPKRTPLWHNLRDSLPAPIKESSGVNGISHIMTYDSVMLYSQHPAKNFQLISCVLSKNLKIF